MNNLTREKLASAFEDASNTATKADYCRRVAVMNLAARIRGGETRFDFHELEALSHRQSATFLRKGADKGYAHLGIFEAQAISIDRATADLDDALADAIELILWRRNKVVGKARQA